MRTALALLVLSGCNNEPFKLDTGDTADTGLVQCGRIRGTEAVLMYQDGGTTVRSPLEAPDAADLASGIAGPLGDPGTYVAIGATRALVSLDYGCNWEAQGALPAGDWRARAAGARVYAFDMASAAGARSDDLGLTWAPFDAVEPFIGVPVVDTTNPERLRGLQARGVVTSSDGGETWSVGAGLPPELTGPTDGDIAAGNTDIAVVGGGNGAWRTDNGGTSWAPVLPDVAVTALAIHPDDPAVVFAQATDAEGVHTISRTADSGATWARQVDSAQIPLSTSPELWPVPGDTGRALTAYGPVFNENVGADGLNLYILAAGEGTRTVFVGTWFHLNQGAFGEDRWMAAVDAVSAR